MNQRILNWGLLSTARINRSLIPMFQISERNRLEAVASRDLARAKSYAREWNIPLSLGSYEELLANPGIDVIYNPLPNNLHAEWTIKALRAGKHVLCEKPLALTLAEVDAMSTAARETGKVLAEAFMYRHHPQTLKAKEIVDSGALGKIQVITGAFTFKLTREGNFRSIKEMGGGSIWDVGCYPISYARMILGTEPLEVFGWQVTGPGGSDETFIGQMKFPNDVHVQFHSGFKSPFTAYIEIIGSEGKLSIPEPFKPGLQNEIHLSHNDKTETIHISGKELYLGEVEDMADAILLGQTTHIRLDDSRANIATILALLQSAETNHPIPL